MRKDPIKLQSRVLKKVTEYKFYLITARRIAKDLYYKPAIPRRIIQTGKPLLFISQIQRSGGTLLSQLFDNHKSILAYPSEIMVGRPKIKWPDIDVANLSPKLIFDFFYDRSIDSLICNGYTKESRGTSGSKPFRFDFSRSYFKMRFCDMAACTKIQSQRQALDYYFAAFFETWKNYPIGGSSHQYISGFTPRINMDPSGVNRFFNDYPDGRLITIVREPISWYASAQRHSPVYQDVKESINLWTLSTEASLRLASEMPHQVKAIPFESLIKNTETTMRRLADWLGISWDPSLLQPTYCGLPIKADSSFKVQEYGIISSTAQRDSVLEEKTKETINIMTKTLMKRLKNFSTTT